MDIAALHPELQKAYGRIPSIPFHNRAFLTLVNLAETFQRDSAPRFSELIVEDKQLSHCKIRIYRPAQNAQKAGLLWMHGGGYILGKVGISDRECAALARELRILVVSVEYRVAPRHPFPAAIDDCLEAWTYMAHHAEPLRIDPRRIGIIGQSAGGGLAASLTHRIADLGGTQPAAQVLMYPMLDDRTALDTPLDHIKHRLWNNKNNRGAWSWYLGQPVSEASVPSYAVPARRNDLRGLPPAWIGVGELDLFCKEDTVYAERLRRHGVPCELYIGSRCPHAFDLIARDAPVSQAFVTDYYRFLRAHLALS